MAFSVVIGTLNITSFIAVDGFKWERNDIDSPNSGRDKNGLMRRNVVARKDKIEITCRPLSDGQMSDLFTVLNAETVNVTYFVPGSNGSTRSAVFYNSKRSAGIQESFGESVLYSGISFDLIEV